jgi:glycosyltransferase involved in cell wall biosynthesis
MEEIRHTAGQPVVSIGLPVYNGDAFLSTSIESLLSQTHVNLEIIISDNASTDRTESICRNYAEQDARIRYSRLEENIGGVRNHGRVRGLAGGKYFMWASYDDCWRPSYVERCVAVLEAEADVVLVYSVNGQIDEHGKFVRIIPPGPVADSGQVVTRWAILTDIYRAIEPFYGVMRRDVLAKAARLRLHPGFDRILLAELGLRGRFRRIPEPDYCRRIHDRQSISTHPSIRSRYRWISPDRRQRFIWPHVEYLIHFAKAAFRSAPGAGALLACLWHLLRWCKWHRCELLADLRESFA